MSKIQDTDDLVETMTGVPSLTVVNSVRERNGVRNYRMLLQRDGADADILMMFAPDGQTFDPSEAVSFVRDSTPNHEEPFLLGDRLVMTFDMVK